MEDAALQSANPCLMELETRLDRTFRRRIRVKRRGLIGLQLSLPPKNESLAEQVNSSKEKNDDKQGKAGAVHARVQAGSGTTGQSRTKHAAMAATLGVVEQTLYNWEG
jgi:hypothetical protein